MAAGIQSMPDYDGDDYRADRRYIIESIDRLDKKMERQSDEISEVRRSMIGQTKFDAMDTRVRNCEGALRDLRVRASVWGGLAGLIPVVMWLAARAIGGGK